MQRQVYTTTKTTSNRAALSWTNILRSSSDFSRVHVKRTDPETQKSREFTVDVQSIWFNKTPRTDDLWLRDGDVIEVPDKAE